MKKLWLILLSTMLIFGFQAAAVFADDVEAQTESQVVAKIENDEYSSLAVAVSEANSDDTIVLVKDVVLTETLTVPSTMTIDLGNHSIFGDGISTVIQVTGGTLTIQGDTNGRIYGRTWNDYTQAWNATTNDVRVASGAVVLKSGTLDNAFTPLRGDDGTTITVKGGKAEGLSAAVYSYGNIDVQGGTLTGNGSSANGIQLLAGEGKTVTVSGGTITGTKYGIMNTLGTIIVSGNATVSGDLDGIKPTGGEVTVMDDAVITSSQKEGIGNYSGAVLNIQGGSIIGKTYGVMLANTNKANPPSAITITGGFISGENNGVYVSGVKQEGNTVSISGTPIIVGGSQDAAVAVKAGLAATNIHVGISGGIFSSDVTQFVDSAQIPVAHVTDPQHGVGYGIGDEVLKEAAEVEGNTIVITQGSIAFDQKYARATILTASSDTPAGVVSNTEGESALVIGEDLLKEYAKSDDNAIVVTQGSIAFDQDIKATVANEGSGMVTVGDAIAGNSSQEMAKLIDQNKVDAGKIAALEEAQKEAQKKADAQLAAAYTPVKVALKSVKKGKKKATVRFKRVEGKNIGYEIQFTNKDTNAVKKVTMNQGKKQTLKKTVKGLKKKTTYVVQVRAFNKVNGKTYYGKWSKKRNVNIK